MEAPDEDVTTHIAKGKRTKRQRVQSPIPYAPTTNSSSGDAGGRGGGGGGGGSIVGDDDDDNDDGKNNIDSWSPPTSSNNVEEDEDMANCLILLAQGVCRESPKPDNVGVDVAVVDDNDTTGVYYNNHTNIVVNTNNKFSSRKFLEAATGSGKVGYYVYECKTCNRTFPSFQALGGHRASHKKPKTTFDEKKHLTVSSDEEDGNYKNISSLSLQLSNHNNSSIRGMNNNHINNNKAKIHECSICGAEFTSGQALGGHMRRHRSPMGNSSNTNLSLTPMAIECHEEPKKARTVISLDLDLNLPAPEDDKFSSFASKQQQHQQQKQPQDKTPLLFSSPALVDCHY
ncbi:hypothetical protein K2173_004156 [Erythroxylum novogranatense]|uniref:C2H2-type domain-containing protein n=1 Tax=Erythroxylum novogranatense TaxID=1862640 RepID=A0AAV8SZ02_9ROSI|nr:hypothetical protein K2173_004156 [Erythroxylum novogranatense]